MSRKFFVKDTDYATEDTAGVVKVGEGLSVSNEGVLSVSSSGQRGNPYIYVTLEEYMTITPVANTLYWVLGNDGKHGVYMNGALVEGENLTAKIYGVSWYGTGTTAWTRTDKSADFSDPVPYMSGASNYGSPFDNCYPWSGMKISERTGGTMVSIPKFWYKITQSGLGMKIQIADSEVEGFSVSPAHMDRGDGIGERDVVYIGRYHCGSSAYKSVSGQKPKVKITRSSARSSIHNLGSNIWQSDFAMRFTIWLLYIVEFANWDSQSKIGYGCGKGGSTESMGYTDRMPYHTGTTQSSRTTYGLGTQYRYIEGLWDNVFDWCDGCYYNSNGLNIINNPNNFSDSSNGVVVDIPSSGYPSAFTVMNANGIFPLFIPTTSGGSSSTYSCDFWTFDSSTPCLKMGGHYTQSLQPGLFNVSSNKTTDTYDYIGCRLQELP